MLMMTMATSNARAAAATLAASATAGRAAATTTSWTLSPLLQPMRLVLSRAYMKIGQMEG